MRTPLILLEVGHNKWRIMEPYQLYGNDIRGHEDRRYRELCEVNGGIDDALRLLHHLEANETARV